MSNMHPGLVLLVVSFIVTFLPQTLRRMMLIVGPLLAGAAFLQIEQGTDLTTVAMGSYVIHYLYADKLNLLFGVIICILTLISGMFTYHNGNKKLIMSILATAGSAFGVLFAKDWISFLFSWELMIVASTFMIWSRQTDKARSAGLRYLILHMIAANLLLEAVFVNAAEGSTMITPVTDSGTELYWLLLLFFTVSAALFPLHAWIPDSCSESTLTGSVVLSAYVPICAIYSMIRVFSGQEILLYLGGITAIYSAMRALLSNDVRRILSYSISAQLGIATMLVGVGSELALNAVAALAFAGVFGNAVLFMGGVMIIRALGGEQRLSHMGNLAKYEPVIAICFLIGGLTISGMPLFGGFTGLVWGHEAVSGLHNEIVNIMLVLAQAGIFCAIVMRTFWFMFYSENQGAKISNDIPGNAYAPLVIGAAVCLMLGIFPGLVIDKYPFAEVREVFTLSGILPAIGTLAAAGVAARLLNKALAPRLGLILDTDWIYRSIANLVITRGSHLLCALCSALGSAWKMLYEKFLELTSNPMEFLDARPFRTSKKYNPENYRTSIADPMMITLTVLIFAIGYFVTSI